MQYHRASLRSRLLFGAVTIIVLAALAAYAWRGSYARYHSDDYCSAARLHDLGFVEAMKFHRTHWSGRYSYFAIKAIPESIGPGTARVMPMLVMTLFCGACVFAMRRMASPLVAVMAGVTIVFATIDATPDILEVWGPLMWETGLLTYMLPLVLYALWAGLLIDGRAWVVSALLMFVAGGLSETSLAAQGAITLGALLIVRTRPQVRFALAGLAATLGALAVMATAPGNHVRLANTAARQALLPAIAQALSSAYTFVGSHLFLAGAALIVVLLVGILAGAEGRVRVRTCLLAALTSLAAYVATMLPSTWMLSKGPVPRALHVSVFCLAAMLFALGLAAGAVRTRIARIAAVLLVVAIIVPIGSAIGVMRTMPEARYGAAQLDGIASTLHAHRGEEITVRSPWALAQRVLSKDPQYWTNVCTADYWGARSLRVTR